MQKAFAAVPEFLADDQGQAAAATFSQMVA